MKEFFYQIGWDLKLMVAGFWGGVLNAFVFKQTDTITVIGSIIAGVFTANYVAPVFAKLFSIPEGLAGFAVGLGAMSVCQGIANSVKKIQIIRGLPPNDKGGS